MSKGEFMAWGMLGALVLIGLALLVGKLFPWKYEDDEND